ncbi:MAG: UTP--glucose-1-phosphate uridylyltransferase GalU [Pseudomonadota bacterium]
MIKKVTKAVFPVAGLGTRFLPATKSVPKEMLPLVDRPLVQYAIDEAREAGIEEFIFVTAKGKSALEDYFDASSSLERALEEKGKLDLLAEVRNSTLPSGAIAHIRQHEALGLGHAVWCARNLIGDEPFAVILPDDVIAGEQSCLAQMVEAYAANGSEGCMVAAMDVPAEKTKNYGVLDIAEDMGRLVRTQGMVEKPEPTDAPSNTAVIGRYILTPDVMVSLNQMKKGAGGEIQLTDAIAEQVSAGRPVFGYRFEGTRFDCGSKAGYLQATVTFALEREELADEFLDYLRAITEKRVAAE